MIILSSCQGCWRVNSPNIEITAEHPHYSEIVTKDCSNFNSTSCQIIAFEQIGKIKTTQTKRSTLSTTARKGTQTLLILNSLSKLLVFPGMNSTASQNDASDNGIELHLLTSSKTNDWETGENVVGEYVVSSKTRKFCKAVQKNWTNPIVMPVVTKVLVRNSITQFVKKASLTRREAMSKNQSQEALHFLISPKVYWESAKIYNLWRAHSTNLRGLPKMWKQLLSYNRKKDWKLLQALCIMFIKPKPSWYFLVNWFVNFWSSSMIRLLYRILTLSHIISGFTHRNGTQMLTFDSA